MKSAATVVLIEDDMSAADGLRRVLQAEGYTVRHHARGDEGLKSIEANEPADMVLTDLRLPGLGGLELVRRLHTSRPRLPVILMTAHGTTETAIEATKLGAYDYLLKPFEMEELLALVERAVEGSRRMTETVDVGGSTDGQRPALVGNSRQMQTVYKEIGRIAGKSLDVLIRGETGTGKELVARALYQHSKRAGQPFIAVNCAAIPETLLESELFGHERGAFTGADTRRIGRFEQAQGGTLFLDEIGELSPGTQAKLLRVLQERAFQRLGGRETVQVDVRMLAATHVNLEDRIQRGEFREDLYYRLNAAVIFLPSLRDRPEDIALLAAHLYTRHAGDNPGGKPPVLLAESLAWLKRQPWPGNIRQLENVLRQASLQARGYAITESDLETVSATRAESRPHSPSLSELVRELLDAARRGEGDDVARKFELVCEKELYSQAIQRAEGNQAQAARWLGISRLTLREKLRQHGLHPSQ
ncbi:MAG TPA: sigma-54 dependent transcriptional regulator [Roseimicrobium sp.]|nr:sigma-54 dependent transcriptional regulator [Roseimicrobium sp.]